MITQENQPYNSREELDGPAVSALRRAIAEVKQHWSDIGWVAKRPKWSSTVLRKAR
jgi:hypothetical protein